MSKEMARREDQNGKRYLTLVGASTYLNAFVKNGEVVLRGETIEVGDAMYVHLAKLEYLAPKIDEMRPMFRDATEEEYQAFLLDQGGDEPETMSRRNLLKAAREEQVSMGAANPDTEENLARDKRLQELRDPLAAPRPAKRRRASPKT